MAPMAAAATTRSFEPNMLIELRMLWVEMEAMLWCNVSSGEMRSLKCCSGEVWSCREGTGGAKDGLIWRAGGCGCVGCLTVAMGPAGKRTTSEERGSEEESGCGRHAVCLSIGRQPRVRHCYPVYVPVHCTVPALVNCSPCRRRRLGCGLFTRFQCCGRRVCQNMGFCCHARSISLLCCLDISLGLDGIPRKRHYTTHAGRGPRILSWRVMLIATLYVARRPRGHAGGAPARSAKQ